MFMITNTNIFLLHSISHNSVKNTYPKKRYAVNFTLNPKYYLLYLNHYERDMYNFSIYGVFSLDTRVHL